jgi:hypothetical protein
MIIVLYGAHGPTDRSSEFYRGFDCSLEFPPAAVVKLIIEETGPLKHYICNSCLEQRKRNVGPRAVEPRKRGQNGAA